MQYALYNYNYKIIINNIETSYNWDSIRTDDYSIVEKDNYNYNVIINSIMCIIG